MTSTTSMTSTTVTTAPARSDRPSYDVHGDGGPPAPSRVWALSGLGAGVLGFASVVAAMMVDVVYRPEFAGTQEGIAEAIVDKAGTALVFHSLAVAGALLMVVFAAGLHRRLTSVPARIYPLVASAGLVGTAVVMTLGSGLDTEIAGTAMFDPGLLTDGMSATYNHWIGTIPWVWVLAGLAGLAVFAAGRDGVVPRWLGLTGLVLGAITCLLGVSPVQYMAALPGTLWVIVTSLGFLVGDKSYRSAL